jgi:hypothetical protein
MSLTTFARPRDDPQSTEILDGVVEAAECGLLVDIELVPGLDQILWDLVGTVDDVP